jgi:hypothetical protein
VKEEEEEYVLPPHDLGEVKEEEEDVEKDDHDHPHQSMGYWMNEVILEEELCLSSGALLAASSLEAPTI